MRCVLQMLIVAALVTVTPLAAQETRVEQVRFPPGSGETTIAGRVEGRGFVDYRVGARAGQEMSVVLASDHGGNFFNIYEPGTSPEHDYAMYIGSTGGTVFKGSLPSDGDYLVRVYLVRSAARRGEDAEYSLNISITGEPEAMLTSVSPSAMSGSGHMLAWPARFDARGNVPCSAGAAVLDAQCEFRVVRYRSGATIWVVKPGTETEVRVLYFENEVFSSNDSARLSWDRQSDNWQVGADGSENYLIPDALIWGG